MTCLSSLDRIGVFYVILLLNTIAGRRHILTIKNDGHKAVLCSEFGFSKDGFLSVSLMKLEGSIQHISFSLDRSGTNGVAEFVANSDQCFPQNLKFVYFSFDLKEKLLKIHNQDDSLKGIVVEAGATAMSEDGTDDTTSFGTLTKSIAFALDTLHLTKTDSESVAQQIINMAKQISGTLPMPSNQTAVYAMLYSLYKNLPLIINQNDNEKQAVVVLQDLDRLMSPTGQLHAIPFKMVNDVVTVNFTVRFPSTTEEGLYHLYIHHCNLKDGQPAKRHTMNMTLKMVEKNPTSYLSAGDQPLPTLYFIICLVYLTASIIWMVYLRVSKNSVYRIHYLMFAVVLTKSISLAFHGVNFYVIGGHGVHEEGWAVMYYITHIIRGALLFITILLIGAGWAFIKHMLTHRERNVFIIVVPLQILANVATIVIEESEAGSAQYAMWKDIFILVDLACCGAILFPVVWSIRHLQAASQTDGKAAINLRNLRMFRHFYILVICYVYFTRVVAYLLSITVAYSLTWVVELFKESVTFLFFVAVGSKFRPVSDNPYLLVPENEDNDEDEDTLMERTELEDVWSQSGVTDGVIRLTRAQPHRKRRDKISFDNSTDAATHSADGTNTNPVFHMESLEPYV